MVAEGAGAHICSNTDLGKDAGGNKILPDIGSVLKTEIKKYFKEKKMDITIKFNDPAYMIRSVPCISLIYVIHIFVYLYDLLFHLFFLLDPYLTSAVI